MSNTRRIDDLLAYLDRLTRLKSEADYLCTEEIFECVDAIRSELHLTDEFRKQVIETRKERERRDYT